MDGLLSTQDEAIVRAEQRGADFGVLVEIGTGGTPRAEIEQALAVVVDHWPSVAARVVREGHGLRVRHDPPARVAELAHDDDLRGRTVLASRGDRLLRYRLDEDRRVLQLLGHHVVLDADSLDAFVADLDAVLAGRPPHGAPEWPWAPVPQAEPALPDQRPARIQPTPGSPADLAASSTPRAGTHARRPLARDLADRVGEAARACGVTPFGIYWAAAARLVRADGDTAAVLSTVVSSRLLARTPRRSGNATTHLTVALGAPVPGRDGVRATFGDFTATWRGRRTPADVTTAPLLVSLSVAPTGHDLEVLGPVELGPYVVKFERHVQVQVIGDEVVLEAHEASSGEHLLDAFTAALTAVTDECLTGSTARTTSSTAATSLPALPARPASQAAESVSALGRLLAAEPRLLVRDVGVTSFDVLSVLDDLAVHHGIRAGVDTFYSWETAGDVQDVVAAALPVGPPAAPEAAPATPAKAPATVVLPHLNDIFIDAYRQGGADPYAVELAFVIDPALAVSLTHLARLTRECLARHEVFRARARFTRDGVVLDLEGPATPVREVRAATWEQVSDPRPLSVRTPARLADVAVAQVGDELGVYVNVHHLLLDHVGLEVLLADLLAHLRGERPAPAVTWASVVEPLARARTAAAAVWARDPLSAADRPVGPDGPGSPAGPVTGGHVQHRLPWGVRERDTLDLEGALRAVTSAVGRFTGQRRGLVGSVHHGRTVPGSERLVGALARVLPTPFDLDDPAVLGAGVRRLLAGQAALAADTGSRATGAGTLLPLPVVFQAIRASGTSGRAEHPGLLRRLQFDARTKFAVLLTLVAAPAGDTLEVTLSTDHYGRDDLDRLVRLLADEAPASAIDPCTVGASA